MTALDPAAPASAGGATSGRRGADALRRVFVYLGPVATVAALVLLWQIWVTAAGIKPFVLPTPVGVWEAFIDRPMIKCFSSLTPRLSLLNSPADGLRQGQLIFRFP
ncbi:MAG: hypothetical protein SW019_24020 [Actinomycetota bacterium]|nr:hypothetical protein [Actinomycetota bacterium]